MSYKSSILENKGVVINLSVLGKSPVLSKQIASCTSHDPDRAHIQEYIMKVCPGENKSGYAAYFNEKMNF